MKPYLHAQRSVHKWGGVASDYLPIHDFFDSSKAHIPDIRHRAYFHNSFGIFLVEKMFGTFIINSSGTKVQTRDIGEQHVIDDMGYIPTVQDFFKHMGRPAWFGGPKKKMQSIPLNVD